MPSQERLLSRAIVPTCFEPGRAIDDVDLKRILEAGRIAPSTFNLQPWQFAVVRAGDSGYDAVFASCEFDLGRWTYPPVLIIGWYLDELPSRFEAWRRDSFFREGLDDVAIKPFREWSGSNAAQRIDWGKRQVMQALEGMRLTAATLGHCTSYAWRADEVAVNEISGRRSGALSLAAVLAVGRDSVWSNHGDRRQATEVFRISGPHLAAATAAYRSAIVSFIDLLGFKGVLDRHDAREVEDLLALFYRTSGPGDDGDARSHGLHVHQFSDLTARLIFLDELALGDYDPLCLEIMALIQVQLDILDSGLLLRGGIAIGGMALAGQQCFGPALVDAAKLDEWRPPRIGLSQTCASRVRDKGLRYFFSVGAEQDLLREDIWARAHGFCGEAELFVDYLKAAMEADKWSTRQQEEDPNRELPINRLRPARSQLAARHAALIDRMRRDMDQGIRAKGDWLRDYHRAVQSQFLHPGHPGWLE